MTAAVLRFEFEVDSAEALALNDLLAEEEVEFERLADEEARSRVTGVEVLLFIAIITLSATAIERMANVIYRLNQRFRPLTIVDLTSQEPVVHVVRNAPGMKGKLLVRSVEGEKVNDLTEAEPSEVAGIIKAALPSAGD
jgi:hypothetical protein